MSVKPSTSTNSRSRAPNFTREEQDLLCEVLQPYMHIIESKKTDCVKHTEKQATWATVTEAFNANTKFVNRTIENLLLCYRNMKSRIKKCQSSAKMNLSDPKKKEAFINAVEANRNDWEAVSLEINEPAEDCASTFKEMQKNLKRKESQYKKTIMGTGGGPPPPDDNDEPLMKLKKIIGPQLDGLFTKYDGDSEIMMDYYGSLPDNEKIQPIEFADVNEINDHNITIEAVETNQTKQLENGSSTPLSRVNLLRKKKATPLDSKDNENPPKKENTNAAFLKLAVQKLELVSLQKQVIEIELQIKGFELEDKIKGNKHTDMLREKELEDKIKENKHRDILREKELLLFDMKINNLQ